MDELVALLSASHWIDIFH